VKDKLKNLSPRSHQLDLRNFGTSGFDSIIHLNMSSYLPINRGQQTRPSASDDKTINVSVREATRGLS
jgi:hypothetical protein